MTDENREFEVMLTGLTGGNLLAFLAALGTFRVLSLALPTERIRMSWRLSGGAWRPVIYAKASLIDSALVEGLAKYMEPFRDDPAAHPALLWHYWVPRPTWNRLANKPGRADSRLWGGWLETGDKVSSVFSSVQEQCDCETRNHSDWLAAIGTEMALADGEDTDSALRAPRADYFVGNLASIITTAERRHVENALFKPWTYDDPMDNLSLKFDASEDRRRALQWAAPSGDPDRKKRGNVLGANRLAIEAVPLFPSTIEASHLVTSGFTGRRSTRDFTWGLWNAPVSLDTVRSILTLPGLFEGSPNTAELKEIGISAVYRSRRETIGKTRIFTRAFPK
ncbi:MAG: type I-G CRISPR-associated protein, Cas3-extension family [Phycisphaerae bacterium]